jgi:hypothetical protein
MNVYSEFKSLSKCSIHERVIAFEETCLDLLNAGFAIEKIKQAVYDFESEEMFEASQGLKNAIDYYENLNSNVSQS